MSDDKISNIAPEIEKLLQEYCKSREDLIKDLEVITHLKGKLDLLIPSEINFRNKHLIDDKLKIFTSFFSSILSVRQEINRTIVQEIQLRSKLNPSKNDEGVADQFIREIAEKMEGSNPKNNEIEFPSDIPDEPSVLPETNLMEGTENE